MKQRFKILKRLFGRRNNAARGFDAAKISRLLNDWVSTSNAIDTDIKSGLTTMRARSRDLCQNNDYGRRFMSMLASNVVGPAGIKLQSKVKSANGDLDDRAIDKVERAWSRWCRKENCTVSGRMSFADLQRLFIQTVARDGEILLRKVPNFNSPFRFALQVIEPDYLNHNYSDEFRNIRMGVELDTWKRPTAYHLSEKHPGENAAAPFIEPYQRVDADEIIHAFILDRAEQTRGVPWTVTAMRRLYMLGHYEESELIAARVGAAKMGFIQSPTGYDYRGDDTDSDGNTISEVSPGKIEQLPQGYEFKKFDIDHPNTGFDGFVKAILHGAASGLNVSYANLSNDPSDTNYSSLRQMMIDERDAWKLLQGWMVDHFCRPVFEAWLPVAIISGQLALPIRDIDRWAEAHWQPRRWAWVDPAKEMSANKDALEMKITSRTKIAAEQGEDWIDIFNQLEAEDAKIGEENEAEG